MNVSRKISSKAQLNWPWTFSDLPSAQLGAVATGRLGAILRSHLESPLGIELVRLNPGAPPTDVSFGAGATLFAEDLDDIFCQGNPSLSVLRLIKDSAEVSISNAPDSCPAEVAWLIYFVSIAVALSSCATHISDLTVEDTLRGLRWAMQQPWVDESTKFILRGGVAGGVAMLERDFMMAL